MRLIRVSYEVESSIFPAENCSMINFYGRCLEYCPFFPTNEYSIHYVFKGYFLWYDIHVMQKKKTPKRKR